MLECDHKIYPLEWSQIGLRQEIEKNIYGMKAPWVESPTLGEQVGVKPCL